MKKFVQFKLLYSLMFIALSACLPISHAAGLPTSVPAETPQVAQPQTTVREAQVQSVEIQFSKSSPNNLIQSYVVSIIMPDWPAGINNWSANPR